MSKACKVILFLTTVAGIVGFLFVFLERKRQLEEPLFQDENSETDNEPAVKFEPNTLSLKKATRTYINLV